LYFFIFVYNVWYLKVLSPSISKPEQLTNDSIAGRVAIVTGSSSGNGRAIAILLATEGALVVCSDLSPGVRAGGYEEDNTPTHELIVKKDGKSVFHKADVSSEDDIKSLVEFSVKSYGRLDM
jgi:NAD(P)-dependent dehydrogenase (short-subunit alcohol dehydrogenase family)